MVSKNFVWRTRLIYGFALSVLALATPLTFAPYYCFWLMPLLFAGLIFLVDGYGQRKILSVYYFAWLAYTAQFWWIHTALHDVSGLSNVFAIPLTFLLPLYLALFPAIAFWLLEKFHLSRQWTIGVALPLLWTITEFARERALTGFGWGALGYSQIADNSPLAVYAPIGGIHLVTLITACIGAWLVLAIWQQSIMAALGVFILFSGSWALRDVAFTQGTGKSATVALLQGNIEQSLKFDENALVNTYQRYYQQVSHTQADIVVLPETAFPQFLQHIEPGLIAQFADVAMRNGSALAIGVPALSKDGRGYLNTMANLANYDPDSSQGFEFYSKNHLVPFGEYKPFPAITEPLYQIMNMPLADFQRGGEGQKTFSMANQKVAFNICYEDGFGDELILSARQSTLLANSSNMAWYGNSNAMWQQLQQSQARALELGRYMIRATNTGATAIVSPKGEVLAQLAPNVDAVLEGEIEGMTGQTPYMRMGGSKPLILLLMVISGVLFIWGKWRRKTKRTV